MTQQKQSDRERADYVVNSSMGLCGPLAGPNFISLKENIAHAFTDIRAEERASMVIEMPSKFEIECASEEYFDCEPEWDQLDWVYDFIRSKLTLRTAESIKPLTKADFKDSLEFQRDLAEMLTQSVSQLQAKLGVARKALELIAAPKRADGTYNRCREACEELARHTLEEMGK